MQKTQTENYFTTLEKLVYTQLWLCYSLTKSGVYKFQLLSDDISRDLKRIKEVCEQRNYEKAEWILLKTLGRLSSRLRKKT